jgi:ABC-type transport system involved in cytochrome bd biosynthesis fused ATPase/permease subunit
VRPIAVYTAARLAIFVVLAAVLWLLGLRGLLVFALAVLLSMPVSYLLLGRQLAGVTRALEQRREYRAQLRARLRGEQ